MSYKGSKGFTLLEVSASIALMGIVFFLAFQIFTKANSDAAYSKNQEVRQRVLTQVNQILSMTWAGPTERNFDPSQTLYREGEQFKIANRWVKNPAPAGTTGIQLPEDTLPFLHNALSLVQNSSILQAYRIVNDATSGLPSKKTIHAVYSRCVSMSEKKDPQTIAEILALSKPIIIKNELHCCSSLGSCPSTESKNLKFWPTIFLVSNSGTISALPSVGEREIVPGAGFFTYMDNFENPTKITYMGFLLENRCKLTQAGFGRRSPGRCAKTFLGTTDSANFDTDLKLQIIIEQTKNLSSDVAGSGFIKL